MRGRCGRQYGDGAKRRYGAAREAVRGGAGRRGKRYGAAREAVRARCRRRGRARSVTVPASHRPHGDGELTGAGRHGSLRTMTDTDVRLWRRVHMDLVRYAGCVCRPSC
ncbi:putative leader peptide [Streptomyces daghestanicus]|uniref:Uncharacterized protein n=16 Tax=Streptomyces TaxID=1883 RepID=A0ABQ3PZX7_9ACTN|nr:hypothetical protein GCM10010259_48910 [Streptomyces daghestanicus]GHI30568.1 hypothetical protein Sdagh_22980 [Streptomyces daghestanicus]